MPTQWSGKRSSCAVDFVGNARVQGALPGNMRSSKDEKSTRGGIVLQHQARGGKPFDQGVDRYLTINESRQIHRRLQCCDRSTRSPWEDRCTHDASSARSACFQMTAMSAKMHNIEADQVIVAMASMAKSMLAHVLAEQCRRS